MRVEIMEKKEKLFFAMLLKPGIAQFSDFLAITFILENRRYVCVLALHGDVIVGIKSLTKAKL